jgi:uncharacterized membrane protein YjjB (DUF3815 family)
MDIFFAIVSMLLFAVGFLFSFTIKSDIQIQIVVTLWVGSFLMGAISSNARRLARIEKKLDAESTRHAATTGSVPPQ